MNKNIAAAPKADQIEDGLAMVPAPLQQGECLPLAVASAPDRIWLDLGFDPKETDADFSDLNTPTWSADNASGHGIEYVRADLAQDDSDLLTIAYMSGMHTGKRDAARGAAQAAPAPVAEDAEDAARYRWLKLQARPNEPFELFDKLREAHALVKAFDVFCTRWGGWDASIDAARAQAAQPEGGA